MDIIAFRRLKVGDKVKLATQGESEDQGKKSYVPEGTEGVVGAIQCRVVGATRRNSFSYFHCIDFPGRLRVKVYSPRDLQ